MPGLVSKPDAFLLPPHFAAPQGTPGRPGLIGQRINDALGGVAQLGHDLRSGYTFARLDATATRLYPVGHPSEGAERYEWFVAEEQAGGWMPVAPAAMVPRLDGGRPLMGFLKDDRHREDPEDLEAAFQARRIDVQASPAWQAKLARLTQTTERQADGPLS